jgi:hypothetical protein
MTKMRRRLYVSFTDEQWNFIMMARHSSAPAFVRGLIDQAIMRDRKLLEPRFAAMKKIDEIGRNPKIAPDPEIAKQEARRIAKRDYMRRKRQALASE